MGASKSSVTQFTLNPADPPMLTDEERRRLEEAVIDESDIPDSAAFWQALEPALPETKAQVTLRLDRDVLDFFRAGGRRYQTRINAVLRAFVDAQRGKPER